MIKIKFNGLGIGSNYQADVLIYDLNGNLVYDGQTYNGYLTICLNMCTAYKLIAKSYNETISTIIYTNTYNYAFSFQRSILRSTSITLLLTDYYYNLPIEKGRMILWQR